ncbi:PREDICTED: glutamate receptor ionotropic, kainate 2-like [Polistes canadensis]|uniref:glutamate receptor ionotropic, kainate 2-like n=1 Tax=Polistes canadensis TaxID=91411 RepID=UPI000718E1C6|nr:PREDICTED: glutamate receptor ionotropic, kainate 2-like [Polistes canadensis]
MQLWYVLVIFLASLLNFSKQVAIGGFFDDDELIQEAFELSIRSVNREYPSNIYLEPKVQLVNNDAFDVTSQVCNMVSTGVAGIFGPQDKAMAEHVQSICDTIEMPHITVRWDPQETRGKTVNFYPHANTLSLAYQVLIQELDWQEMIILFENTDSLLNIKPLLELRNTGIDIFLFQLGNGPNYRNVIQEVKETEIENIVIDCSFPILNEVLKQAQQVGIMSDEHNVVVTSLDLQTLNLEPYRYSGVNFTGFRLINPEDPTVMEIFNKHKHEWSLSGPDQLRLEPALMYDAVQLFAQTLKQLNGVTNDDVKQLPCNGSMSWEHGSTLLNFMRVTEMRGLTGLIWFDTAGFRSNFQLDIVQLQLEGLTKIGVWNSTRMSGIEWMPETSSMKPDAELSLQNKTFLVLISMTKPYGMVKESATMLSGNERYEGFGIDIIEELSKSLGFNYTFEVQTDSVYGSYINKTGKWSGMLGKIIEGRADLAITDLTITSDRESAVDFTMPFMNLGISILYQRPTKAPPSFFSFLSPFSNDVWICLLGVFIFVSVLFSVIGRLCPAEWNNPYPCIEEPEELENQFSLKNSFMFTIGSIMQQGSDVAPIGFSTRMMAGCWWFFCLIIISSYTANLTACLAIAANIPPFTNVEELAKQKTIKYGAKVGGSTFEFFKNYANSKEASYQTYKDMYNYMISTEDVLTKDNDEGLKKVLKENYAFLMESSSIEYIIQRECNVTKVGGLLDQKGYGIAMKKNSLYRHQLNTAILKLQESGRVTELKKKWWTQKRGGGKCEEGGAPSSAEELNLSNVGGVFLVLFVGIGFSLLYTIFELVWDVAMKSIKENLSFKEEMMEELRFIAKCTTETKPVRHRKSLSQRSGEDSTEDCSPPYGFVPTVITTSPDDDN